MKVLRARTAGFCMGVSLALHMLDKALAEQGAARLVTFGPIIHNPRLMAAYAARGVRCTEDIAAVRAGDHVLIRAHGVSREVERELLSRGVALIDATCPKVKQAQLAIAGQWERQGGVLLLFGEANHPEVQGLVSYTQGDALVFGDRDELDALPLRSQANCFLAAQTTQNQDAFLDVHRRISHILGYDVPLLATICGATRARQAEALQLADKVGGIVVVGGRNSGNTKRLAEVAAARGVSVALVETEADLPLDTIRGWGSVALTAGASTPTEQIDALEQILAAL